MLYPGITMYLNDLQAARMRSIATIECSMQYAVVVHMYRLRHEQVRHGGSFSCRHVAVWSISVHFCVHSLAGALEGNAN